MHASCECMCKCLYVCKYTWLHSCIYVCPRLCGGPRLTLAFFLTPNALHLTDWGRLSMWASLLQPFPSPSPAGQNYKWKAPVSPGFFFLTWFRSGGGSKSPSSRCCVTSALPLSHLSCPLTGFPCPPPPQKKRFTLEKNKNRKDT